MATSFTLLRTFGGFPSNARRLERDPFHSSPLPHPRSPGGKPQRLTARIKIASAPVFPTASFCRRGQFPICPSVLCVCHARAPSCPWLRFESARGWERWESDVPNLGAKAAHVAPSNARQPKFLHRPKRLRCDSEPGWRCYTTNRAADARPGRPRAHRRTP